MKNYFRLISLTSKLPVFIHKIPYFLALKLSQLYLKLSLPSIEQVWARHSYDCSYFVAGLSDLDLTIVYKRQPTPAEQAKLIRIISNFKKMIPFMGEFNIFTPDLIDHLSPLANLYEIKRDKKLETYFNLRLNLKNNRTQALVFLMKALSNDKKSLVTIPFLRLEKWQYYLNLIGYKLNKTDHQHHLNEIQEIANHLLNEIGLNIKFNINDFLNNALEKQQFFILTSSKWISDSFYQGNYGPFYQNQINQLSENEALIILYQFRGDIFGIATQIYRLKPEELNDMCNYINRIKFVSEKIGEKLLFKEYKELSDQINFLNSQILQCCSID